MERSPTAELAPVITVAERLRPEELYRRFLAFREGLGMTILPLTGGGDVFAQLQELARDRACIVPLLADRDLSDTGVHRCDGFTCTALDQADHRRDFLG